MQNRNPNCQKYIEIADKLDCQVKHVKNWFSYKRKIILKMSRHQNKTYKNAKQNNALEKFLYETKGFLRETTEKLDKTAEKLEKSIEKIEQMEEKNKIIIKIEENTGKQHIEHKMKQDIGGNSENNFMEAAKIANQEAYIKNWLFLQDQMQLFMQNTLQSHIHLQQNQQAYNNWLYMNKVRYLLNRK